MRIKVNGEFRELNAPVNLLALTQLLKLKPTQVAIERNREIVPRSLYEKVVLMDGDEIEIVAFIGGG